MGLVKVQSLQNLHLIVPSSYKTLCNARSCSFSSIRGRSRQSLGSQLAYRRTLFGSCNNLRNSGLKRSCSAGYDEFVPDKEFLKQLEDLVRDFDVLDEDDSCRIDPAFTAPEVSDTSRCNDDDVKKKETNSPMSFLPSKLEVFEPQLLGIKPEPPEYWPERNEVARITIERKANSIEIPMSLRLIKRKKKWQEGIVNSAGDHFSCCSANKAFSSMVFMIRELQIQALCIRRSLNGEDLQDVLKKVQMEMNASFVWLFQQVFSRTPTFMLYLMLLLANFTVHSMDRNLVFAANLSPKTHPEISITERMLTTEETQTNQDQFSVAPDERVEVGNQEMSEEEEELWNSVVEEALRIQQESTNEVLDHDTMRHFVSSLTTNIEPDDYTEYWRTDLIYQMAVAEDPTNPLLLTNYAQFLYLVAQDYNRAEECFNRAIMVEPPDAEALSRYADFLWLIKQDLWSAEERYQEAMAAAPEDHYHASKYASFLWSTGGAETCFPPLNDADEFVDI